MANAVSLQRQSPSSNPDSCFVKSVASGNYTTGGDPVNLTPTTWTDPNGLGVPPLTQMPTIPPVVEVTNAGGYDAQWIPGTDLTNGKLMWFAPGGAQLAAGAYPAAITGATVILQILYNTLTA